MSNGYPGACTAKQAAVLTKNGLPSNVTFQQASAMITQLKAQNWNPQGITVPPAAPPAGQYGNPYPQQQQQYTPPAAPAYQQPGPPPQYQQPPQAGGCTPGQAGMLAKYGYPTAVTFDHASQILDALKANNWQALPPEHPLAPQTVATPVQFTQPQYQPPTQQTPQFQNGQSASWEGTPQFSGVPSFG